MITVLLLTNGLSHQNTFKYGITIAHVADIADNDDMRGQLDDLYHLIDCEGIETVRIAHDAVMIVDDCGAIKDDPLFNRTATRFYPPGIYGRAVIAGLRRESPDSEELVLCDVPAKYIHSVYGMVETVFTDSYLRYIKKIKKQEVPQK